MSNYVGTTALPSSIASLSGFVDNNLRPESGLDEARRELLSGTGFAARPQVEEDYFYDLFSIETHERLMKSLYHYPYLDLSPGQ